MIKAFSLSGLLFLQLLSFGVTICELNGTGEQSQKTIEVTGVVTAVFNGKDQLGKIFIQDFECDRQNSSSGLAVLDPEMDLKVEVGNKVTLKGKIKSTHGSLVLENAVLLNILGKSSFSSTQITLDSIFNPELYEGMLIELNSVFTVVDNYNLGRYGHVKLSGSGRTHQVSELDEWKTSELEDRKKMFANRPFTFYINDGSELQNPSPLPFIDDKLQSLRVGSTMQGLKGIWVQKDERYVLEPTVAPKIKYAPRPESPERKGDYRIVAFNILNFYSTIDDGKNKARGADNSEERERQLNKLVSAIHEMDADIYGLIELENNNKAAIDLLNGINQGLEHPYKLIEHETKGEYPIKVGIIYRPERVRPIGDPSEVPGKVFSRPSLAQKFQPANGGTEILVVVNHFKSKRCGNATGKDANLGDGQSCWNLKRTLQAKALLEFVDSLRAGQEIAVLLMGDFNAYSYEDPIQEIAISGYERLVKNDHTYVYMGDSGMLDHLLSNRFFTPMVKQAFVWHINSDEPRFQDYNMEYNGKDYYSPDPFRSSDHDPIGLDLNWK